MGYHGFCALSLLLDIFGTFSSHPIFLYLDIFYLKETKIDFKFLFRSDSSNRMKYGTEKLATDG